MGMLLGPMVNMWERVTVDVRSSLTRTAILVLHPLLGKCIVLRPLPIDLPLVVLLTSTSSEQGGLQQTCLNVTAVQGDNS